METILLVDDDALFRQIMKRHLGKMGYDVIENDSGVGVKEQVVEKNPDYCIIDIIMDDKEGLETIIELSTLPSRPKLIAVSSSNLYLELAQGLGVEAVLVKPVEPALLQDTLQQLR